MQSNCFKAMLNCITITETTAGTTYFDRLIAFGMSFDRKVRYCCIAKYSLVFDRWSPSHLTFSFSANMNWRNKKKIEHCLLANIDVDFHIILDSIRWRLLNQDRYINIIIMNNDPTLPGTCYQPIYNITTIYILLHLKVLWRQIYWLWLTRYDSVVLEAGRNTAM